MSSSPAPAPDLAQIRARFDAEMRRNPPSDPGERVQRGKRFVRVVGTRAWVAYSDLDEAAAAATVPAEAGWARSTGIELEWKLFDYDRPPTLAGLLRASGFVADPPETLLVYDLRDGRPFPAASAAVEVRRVASSEDLEQAVAVSRTAFAPGPGWERADYLPRLGTPTFEAFLALLDGHAVSVGRLELPEGRSFASLWGGGTTPGFRGRGVYRALVATRAAFARGRGYRYLTVDARASSRPILERLGFRPLAGIVGWVLTP